MNQSEESEQLLKDTPKKRELGTHHIRRGRRPRASSAGDGGRRWQVATAPQWLLGAAPVAAADWGSAPRRRVQNDGGRGRAGEALARDCGACTSHASK
jgi:hypothetical protein